MADSNKTRATRLPDETDEDFQEYRDKNDMTNSEALRSLIRAGLDEAHKGPLDDRPETTLAGLLWDARRDIHTFFAVSLLAAVLSVLTGGLLEVAFGTLSLLYLLTVTVGFVDGAILSNSITLWSMGDAAPSKSGDGVDG